MCFKWNQVEILALKSKTMQIKNPVEVFKIGFELAKIGITNLKSTEMSHLRNRKKKRNERTGTVLQSSVPRRT